MTQDDMPAPAVVDEEKAVIEVEAVEVETPLVEYVPPASPRPEPKLAKPAPPANPSKPAPPRNSAAPDPFAVGVRVLKMAPAWLLFTAVCCSALVLLLGWVRTSGEAEASAVTLPTKRNDARAAKPAPETAAKTEAATPVNPSAAEPSGPKTTAANDAPPAALAQAEPPAPAPQTAPPPVAPKADEKARGETFQQGAGEGKFTAQVGSFNSQSEANERVSALRAAGFEARVAAAELPGRGTWYRVQVGRFADREGAAKAVSELRAKGAAAAGLVVPVQK